MRKYRLHAKANKPMHAKDKKYVDVDFLIISVFSTLMALLLILSAVLGNVYPKAPEVVTEVVPDPVETEIMVILDEEPAIDVTTDITEDMPEPSSEPLESDLSEDVETSVDIQTTIETPVETLPDASESYLKPNMDEQVELLACAIYNEAGGDGSTDLTRKRVADVVLNRVEDPRFPNDIYSVLTSPGQYAGFEYGVVWPARAQNPGEQHAVARAYDVAFDVLCNDNHSDLYGQGYIWQAGFIQGTDVIYSDGHYFGR